MLKKPEEALLEKEYLCERALRGFVRKRILGILSLEGLVQEYLGNTVKDCKTI